MPLIAQNYSHNRAGYNPALYAELAKLEAGHFWFQSRNLLILSMLGMYRPNFASLLEIGCGTGFVLGAIAKKWPGSIILGSDSQPEGLEYAALRAPEAKLLLLDAREIPFEKTLEVIGAFDVLEHIQEDELVLQQMQNALQPGGLLLLTVPQHPWLWGRVDELAGHQRRYSALELHQKLEAAGFKILRSTSFVSLPLPLMYLSRVLGSSAEQDPARELKIPGLLNKALKAVLRLELWAIHWGLDLPVGGTRLVVAQTPGKGIRR
ncbi:MAG: class I SAM-dependent methyltransferase [Desulfohalobiaceae bacterium]